MSDNADIIRECIGMWPDDTVGHAMRAPAHAALKALQAERDEAQADLAVRKLLYEKSVADRVSLQAQADKLAEALRRLESVTRILDVMLNERTIARTSAARGSP